jgi:hypothetical protein
MSLLGTGARFVSAYDTGQNFIINLVLVPVTSYPATGELVSDFIFAVTPVAQAKITAGVRPDNIYVTDNLGHHWSYDPAIGTMGSLRAWTAISNTPTEHATGAYDGNEATALLREIGRAHV